MAIDTTKLPGWETSKDITTVLAAGALTITKAVAYKFGMNIVVQLTYSNSTTGYIKFNSNGPRIAIGGADNTFSTGTEVAWQE